MKNDWRLKKYAEKLRLKWNPLISDSKDQRLAISVQILLTGSYFGMLSSGLIAIIPFDVKLIFGIAFSWNFFCFTFVFGSFCSSFLKVWLQSNFSLFFVLYHYPIVIARCTGYLITLYNSLNHPSLSERERLSFYIFIFVIETFCLTFTRVTFKIGAPAYFLGLVCVGVTFFLLKELQDLVIFFSGFSFVAVFFLSQTSLHQNMTIRQLQKSLSDFSKIKLFENQELLLAKQVEETKAKSLVFGQLAHDIGSPLSALSMAFELLEREIGHLFRSTLCCDASSKKQEELCEAFEAIHASITAIATLRQSMLDYVKKASGVLLKPSVEPVDVKKLVANKAFGILRLLLRSKPSIQASYSLDVSLENIKILSVENWLLDMLLNFISNAVKFTERGVIEIVVNQKQVGESAFICFEVKDTGKGIANDKASELFVAFNQLQNNEGGTGLGLVAVKEKAVLLGGDAGFFNNEGKPGATFYFLVPNEQVRSPIAHSKERQRSCLSVIPRKSAQSLRMTPKVHVELGKRRETAGRAYSYNSDQIQMSGFNSRSLSSNFDSFDVGQCSECHSSTSSVVLMGSSASGTKQLFLSPQPDSACSNLNSVFQTPIHRLPTIHSMDNAVDCGGDPSISYCAGPMGVDSLGTPYFSEQLHAHCASQTMKLYNRHRSTSRNQLKSSPTSTAENPKEDTARFLSTEACHIRNQIQLNNLQPTPRNSPSVVMVVDDSHILLTLYSRMLKKYGIRKVITADSGAACMDILFGKDRQQLQSVVDIILIDDQMPPGLRGPEVMSRIVAVCKKLMTPCPSMYLCTGSNSDALTEEFPELQKHVKYTYQKPITLEIIKAILVREKNLEPISANPEHANGNLFELNTGAVLESQLRTECLRHELLNEL